VFPVRRAVPASVSWSKGGTAWGFDSDKGLDTFLAAARDSTVNGSDWFKTGDARAELPKSATAMEAEYLCDYAYHAQMEPLNAVASVSAAGDSAEIWVGTQSQSNARRRRPPRRRHHPRQGQARPAVGEDSAGAGRATWTS
jgi:isoquinoline 1-oxidoreductase beta subunit